MNRDANCTGYHLPPPQNPIKGGGSGYAEAWTSYFVLYCPNTWTILYCILRIRPNHLIPTSYNITICRTSRAGQRMASTCLHAPDNQRGQYKSDIIAADAVGSAFQCIFNTSHLSNLIIDGKNVKKYQRHICG